MLKFTITPDLQTRESVMTAAGRVQLAVTDAEGTRYIKIEAKAKQPQGSAKRYLPATMDEATHVFISEKGYGTTRLGTYYPAKGVFYEDTQDEDYLEALRLVVAYVNGEVAADDLPRVGLGVTITAESQCGLCGRKLEDPVSVQRGIGPECAQKPTGTKILHASAFAQMALPLPQGEVLGVVSERYSVVDPNADSAPVSADDNNADRARVELGIDVQGMTGHQLAILAAAVAEEATIRAARRVGGDLPFDGPYARQLVGC